MSNLKINQYLRQTAVEVMYDLITYFDNTGTRLFKDNTIWTVTRDIYFFIAMGFSKNKSIVHNSYPRLDGPSEKQGCCIARRF